MHRLEHLAELSADSVEPFVTILWDFVQQRVGLRDVALPEGIGELEGTEGVVEYAVSRSSTFAAVRWHEGGTRHEAFCVRPEGLLPQLGHVQHRAADSPAETSVPWWIALSVAAIAKQPQKSLPGFLQLAMALAGAGPSAVATASTNTQLQTLQHELAYFKDLADDQGEELRQLRGRLRDLSTLSYRPDALSVQDEDDLDTSEPVADLKGLPQWAQDNEHRIVVMPRALNGAKKSIYKNPAAVYRALEYLAGPYRDYRLNRINKAAVDEALVKTGMKVAGSVAPSVAGEQGEAYYVSWDGRRRFLEHHLVRGGGRDERYCLRVYYFWDDASQRVVVGWLPSHLSNSLS